MNGRLRLGRIRPVWFTWFVLLCLLLSPAAAAQVGTPRTVNAPYQGSSVNWAQTAIFWFGEAELRADQLPPGRNYVDVRVAYNDAGLLFSINAIDYFAWYDAAATATSDLRLFDGAAIYLDTSGGRNTTPQPSSYYFLSGLYLTGHISPSSVPNYQRSARGRGGAWDTSWKAPWQILDAWSEWCPTCSAPNSNSSAGVDYGWFIRTQIPWASLGLSGPPPAGQTWGLGVVLYDRDEPLPAAPLPPQVWPETFDAQSPATWGWLRFGATANSAAPGLASGQTVIRRGLGTSRVEDAWIGGGGVCGGGHMGDPDGDYHGDDMNLFVGNQYQVADFPCSSKSYLRFYLEGVPPGSTILSATLTMHHWGNAYPPEAHPSLVQVFTVDNTWAEDSLSWNNAPMARENIAATWVSPLPDYYEGPGNPYTWDVTAATAAAYATGSPLSIALYSADWYLHGSKYLRSSEVDDWYAAARPTLTIVWGDTGRERVHLPLLSAGR